MLLPNSESVADCNPGRGLVDVIIPVDIRLILVSAQLPAVSRLSPLFDNRNQRGRNRLLDGKRVSSRRVAA
jgi:hypothetical protein